MTEKRNRGGAGVRPVGSASRAKGSEPQVPGEAPLAIGSAAGSTEGSAKVTRVYRKRAPQVPYPEVPYPVTRAVLVYQGGLANVFAVESFNLADYGRDAVRVLQHSFRTCEDYCAGLIAAGATVKAAACNMAGDIASQPWTDDLASVPFRDKMRPPGELPLSYYVELWAARGSLLLGGVRSTQSSRFELVGMAADFLEQAVATNERAGRKVALRAILPSARPYEISARECGR